MGRNVHTVDDVSPLDDAEAPVSRGHTTTKRMTPVNFPVALEIARFVFVRTECSQRTTFFICIYLIITSNRADFSRLDLNRFSYGLRQSPGSFHLTTADMNCANLKVDRN
eukprot:817232-Prorocentrum_minimum.AAC.1